MNISFFDITPSEEVIIKTSLQDHDLYITKEPLTSAVKGETEKCEILSFFVSAHIDAEILDKLPNLKCIATRSTGFDHIDIEECKKRGIVVMNVPAYGSHTVAEYTFSLILSLTRKINQSFNWVKNSEKSEYDMLEFRGVDVKEKTLGVIGTGKIGKEVIKIAINGFEMNVIAYDLYEDADYAKKLGYKYTTLEDLLKNSDIITLHCPCTPETRHIINSGNIGLVKKGAYIVNTARGELIETDALINALENKEIGGVGLDVLEEKEDELKTRGRSREEEIKTILDQKNLHKISNAILTPHNAFNSKEAVERILKTTIENIESFIANKPQNRIV
jgi:D-lactate dehydrogenase